MENSTLGMIRRKIESKIILARHHRNRLRSVSTAEGLLPKLGLVHGTDKATHSHLSEGYLSIYERYLHDIRENVTNVLEIGVAGGDSLRMWRDYFPRAQIVGIDIDPSAADHAGDRIRVVIGSQDDEQTLARASEEAGEFDLIIDDGSHLNEMTLASFNHLFRTLHPGGLYFIEDLSTSYKDLTEDVRKWRGMRHSPTHANFRNDRRLLDEFFLGVLKNMDHLRGNIAFCHFWPSLCVLKKVSGAHR